MCEATSHNPNGDARDVGCMRGNAIRGQEQSDGLTNRASSTITTKRDPENSGAPLQTSGYNGNNKENSSKISLNRWESQSKKHKTGKLTAMPIDKYRKIRTVIRAK